MAHFVEAKALLDEISVAQFCEQRPPSAVVKLHASWTVAAALATLQRRGLLAAPLVASEDEDSDSEDATFLGFLRVADIAAVLVDCYTELAGGTAGLACHVQAAGAWLARLACAGIPRCNDAELVFGREDTLLQLVQQTLLNPPTKLFARRVGVVDKTEDDSLHITHIVSQFDILCLLWRHREQLAGLMAWTLGDLGFAPKPVTTVPASTAAVDCLAACSLDSCSAAGVVDSSRAGVLMGNLSTADLRGLTADLFSLLTLPIADFLARRHCGEHTRGAAGFASAHGIKSPGQLAAKALPLATCTLDTPFGELLEELVTNHFHRSWLVDGAGRPAGVLSATDILQAMAG